jgi:hypothetical protein
MPLLAPVMTTTFPAMFEVAMAAAPHVTMIHTE